MFTWFARKIAKSDTPISDEDRAYSQWLLESSRQAALDDFRGNIKTAVKDEDIPEADKERVYSQWLLESSRQAALDDFRGTAKATEAEEEIPPPPRLFYEPIAYKSY